MPLGVVDVGNDAGDARPSRNAWTLRLPNNRSREPPKGEATFLSGSGKYAGISGKFEYTIDFLPRLTKDLPSQGNLHFISREKGSYKISGATQ